MNFYKKALVASAIVASFGATAAKITPSASILQISKEGIAADITVPDNGFDINVKAEVLTGSASKLKIVFGAGVDLDTVTTTGTTTQAVDTNGIGTSTDGDVTITFGSGSFTFDSIELDTDTEGAHFITFDVSIGQPIAAEAAFNVSFAKGKVASAATATYTANEEGGALIDSGSGAISEVVEQFSFGMGSKFDGVINRTNANVYTDTGTEDVLTFDLVTTLIYQELLQQLALLQN
jgi:hypothetical protein